MSDLCIVTYIMQADHLLGSHFVLYSLKLGIMWSNQNQSIFYISFVWVKINYIIVFNYFWKSSITHFVFEKLSMEIEGIGWQVYLFHKCTCYWYTNIRIEYGESEHVVNRDKKKSLLMLHLHFQCFHVLYLYQLK